MSDEEKDNDTGNPEMKDLTSTSFGYVIAFLLPGLFGIYALSSWLPNLAGLLSPIFKFDATVGPSVLLLLSAIGVGLFVSAMRFWLFEKILCRKHRLPPDTFALLYKDAKLPAFRALVDEHYRYHQFYGGCAIAAPVLFFGWWHMQDNMLSKNAGLVAAAFIASEFLLACSANEGFIRYIDRGHVIVTGTERPKPVV